LNINQARATNSDSDSMNNMQYAHAFVHMESASLFVSW